MVSVDRVILDHCYLSWCSWGETFAHTYILGMNLQYYFIA